MAGESEKKTVRAHFLSIFTGISRTMPTCRGSCGTPSVESPRYRFDIKRHFDRDMAAALRRISIHRAGRDPDRRKPSRTQIVGVFTEQGTSAWEPRDSHIFPK